MSTPRPVNNLLNAGDGTIGRLMERARWLDELTDELRRHLNPSVAAHCRIANLRSGVLVLQTDSPAWATRLRYHIPMLRETLLDQGLGQIRDVRVKVAPAEKAPRSSSPRKARLSARTAEVLLHAAEASDDPALRDALARLARRNRE
jgi:hypothetical protein